MSSFNIRNNNMFNNNRLIQQNNDSSVKEYENLKSVYNGYVEKMADSEVGESFTRYNVELNLLKNMKEVAQKHKLDDELEYITDRESCVLTKLEDMGFKLKSD